MTEKRKENRKSPKAWLDFIVPIKLTTTADGGDGKKEETEFPQSECEYEREGMRDDKEAKT